MPEITEANPLWSSQVVSETKDPFDFESEMKISFNHNRILKVTISNMVYPINADVLHEVFDPYGYVEKINTTFMPNGLQAFVKFQSTEDAICAKNQLQGRNIYNGCCYMDIQYFRYEVLKLRTCSTLKFRSNIETSSKTEIKSAKATKAGKSSSSSSMVPCSLFNKKNAMLKPFDGNLEGDYFCNICRKDVSSKRINCKICFDLNLCMECYSSKIEIGVHKNNHPCRLIEIIVKKEVKSSLLSLKPSRKIMKKHNGKKFGKSYNLFEEMINRDFKIKDVRSVHQSKTTCVVNLTPKLDKYVGGLLLPNSLQPKQLNSVYDEPNHLNKNYDEPNSFNCTISLNDSHQKETTTEAYKVFVEMAEREFRTELIHFSALKCEHGVKYMLVDNILMSMQIKVEATVFLLLPWPPPHIQPLSTFCNFILEHHSIFGKLSCTHEMFEELHSGSEIVNGTANIFVFDPDGGIFEVDGIFDRWYSYGDTQIGDNNFDKEGVGWPTSTTIEMKASIFVLKCRNMCGKEQLFGEICYHILISWSMMIGGRLVFDPGGDLLDVQKCNFIKSSTFGDIHLTNNDFFNQ